MSYTLPYSQADFAPTAAVSGSKIYANDQALLAAVNAVAQRYNVVPYERSSLLGTLGNGAGAESNILVAAFDTPTNGQLRISTVSVYCAVNPATATVKLEKHSTGTTWTEIESWTGTMLAGQLVTLGSGSSVSLVASSKYRIILDVGQGSSGATAGTIVSYNGYSGFTSL